MNWIIATVGKAFNISINPETDIETSIQRGIFYGLGFTQDKLAQYHIPYGENIFWVRNHNGDIVFESGYWVLQFAEVNRYTNITTIRFNILAFPGSARVGYVTIVDDMIYLEP